MRGAEHEVERGSVSVVASAVMFLLLVMALATADLCKVLAAVGRAQAAADAAALAAAQDLAMPTGSRPEDSAAQLAGTNGASLLTCDCAEGSTSALVRVAMPVGELLFLPGKREVTAVARAVVDLGG